MLVELELVAEREAVDVHDHGVETRLFDHAHVLDDLGLLHGDQDQIHGAVVATHDVIVEEDLVDRERNVVLGFELHRVSQLLDRHFRNLDLLDDQLAPRHTDGRFLGPDGRSADGVLDGLDDARGIFDRAFRDRIGRQ